MGIAAPLFFPQVLHKPVQFSTQPTPARSVWNLRGKHQLPTWYTMLMTKSPAAGLFAVSKEHTMSNPASE